MDRQIVYQGQIPLETDLLNTNKNTLLGLSKLASAVLGSNTVVNGLACSPTTPPSLQIQIAPGEIYAMAPVDATSYSTLAIDTHSILKQGILLDPVTLNCPAPSAPATSVNYLVQASYLDIDTNSVVLPYYNASNPQQAYTGQGGNNVPQNTIRRGVCGVSIKTGAAAATGTQVTPSPDAGYVGLWVVTVAYGQSAVSSLNISRYTNAPIMPSNGLLGAMQSGGLNYADDTGAPNAYAVNLPIPPAAYYDGMQVGFSTTNSNTIASPTLNVNGLGAMPLTNPGGGPLAIGQIPANAVVEANYNSTGPRFELVFNETVGDLRYQLSGADGSGANVVWVAANTTLTQAMSGREIMCGAAVTLTLPAASLGINYRIYPYNNTVTLTTSGGSFYTPDSVANGTTYVLPVAGAGYGAWFEIYSLDGTNWLIRSWGRTMVAPAVNANEAVALGQGDSRYFPIKGNPNQPLTVGNAITQAQAVALAQSMAGATIATYAAPARVQGVWYTNTTSRPRWVSIHFWCQMYNSFISLQDGTGARLGFYVGPYGYPTEASVYGLVLPGHSYIATSNWGNWVSEWTEIG